MFCMGSDYTSSIPYKSNPLTCYPIFILVWLLCFVTTIFIFDWKINQKNKNIIDSKNHPHKGTNDIKGIFFRSYRHGKPRENPTGIILETFLQKILVRFYLVTFSIESMTIKNSCFTYIFSLHFLSFFRFLLFLIIIVKIFLLNSVSRLKLVSRKEWLKITVHRFIAVRWSVLVKKIMF